MKRLLLVWVLVFAAALAPAQPESDRDLVELSARAENFTKALLRGDLMRVRWELEESLNRALTDEAINRVFGTFHREGGEVREISPPQLKVLPNGRVEAVVPMHSVRQSIAARIVYERKAPLAKIVEFSAQRIAADEEARKSGLISEDSEYGQSVVKAPYIDRQLFHEELYQLKSEREALPAILTMPAVAGPAVPAPGVVLVGGFPGGDADRTEGESKPFRDLAQGLATEGIAVLRYASRDFQIPDTIEPQTRAGITDLLIADAVAAVESLAAHVSVDSGNIVIVGHGLGAFVAPLIAESTETVDAMVLMAPIVEETNEYLRVLIERLPPPEAEEEAEVTPTPTFPPAEMNGPQLLQASESRLGLSALVWMELRHEDPLEKLDELRQPFFVLEPGSAQVVPEVCRADWGTVLARAGFRSGLARYPELDVYLRPADGKSPYVDEQVIADVARFVWKRKMPVGE